MDKGIVNLPLEDRPYEKLEKLGSTNLTNSELLAIIIKTGTKNKSCLDIARDILKSNLEKINELDYLNNLSMEKLRSFDGIGRVKAIQIKAVIELSKRISKSYNEKKFKITCPKDIYELLKDTYAYKRQEILKSVILDKANNVMSVNIIGIGSVSSVETGIREIFTEPIKQMASAIILVHNHPSGNITPSKADIKLTNVVKEYGNIFEIKLLDHIIIGKNEYLSLNEEGYI